MQTIDEIKKSNELSKVLKKHGLANDMLEANKEAKKIISKETNNTEIDNILQKINNVEHSKHILNDRVNSLQQQIEDITIALKNALQKIDSLESKIKRLSNNSQQITSQQNVHNESTSQKSVNQTVSERTQKKSEENDVSIEHMFYYGNK